MDDYSTKESETAKIYYKLAPYGTEGRLFTSDVSANFKFITQKLNQISKIWPNQI